MFSFAGGKLSWSQAILFNGPRWTLWTFTMPFPEAEVGLRLNRVFDPSYNHNSSRNSSTINLYYQNISWYQQSVKELYHAKASKCTAELWMPFQVPQPDYSSLFLFLIHNCPERIYSSCDIFIDLRIWALPWNCQFKYKGKSSLINYLFLNV